MTIATALSIALKLDWTLYGGILFGAIYVLYFTYADLNISLGKKMFKIRVVSKRRGVLNSRKTFSRALITLLSLPFLGIPSLCDFQGKLTDTKLIKE